MIAARRPLTLKRGVGARLSLSIKPTGKLEKLFSTAILAVIIILNAAKNL
jgi:hypothetical protein